MKYELRIEIKDTGRFLDLIKKSYKNGFLADKNQKLIYDNQSHIFHLCKGLTNLTARLYNEEIIEGTIKFLISEEQNCVYLYPCSLYCEFENNRYIFSA
jgi:hypothetical protein